MIFKCLAIAFLAIASMIGAAAAQTAHKPSGFDNQCHHAQGGRMARVQARWRRCVQRSKREDRRHPRRDFG